MKIGEITSQSNVNLSSLSTIKIGGIADVVYFPKNADELQLLLNELPDYKIIGKCSNILFPDDVVSTPIVSLKEFKTFNLVGNIITVGAGYSLPLLSLQAEKYGLSGLEFASHIPASVGGAIYMNAGAFGGTIGNLVISLMVFENGQIKVIDDYKKTYRYSEFMDDKTRIILSATFELKHDTIENIKSRTASFTKIRFDTQPYNKPSLGSVFKQNEGEPVWKMIDGVGLRGHAIGGAEYSEKHCNFIINTHKARSKDVVELITLAKTRVKEKYDVELKAEVEVW